MHLKFILAPLGAATTLMGGVPRDVSRRATTFLTGAPLTLSFSPTPFPTQTGTDVASAYAKEVDACTGPGIARVIQDTLAAYSNHGNLDELFTNPLDPTFITFANSFPAYTNARHICESADLSLFAAEDEVDTPTSSTTSTPVSGSTGEAPATSPSASASTNSGVGRGRGFQYFPAAGIFLIGMWMVAI
ncbi:hypothetical protein C8R43DRAFT_1136676 [Mycena crocata]|nr:hypothetical protein C8R43DRAFT_1136676 [Mycena crocata]